MKITVTETVSKEVDLPKYFKCKRTGSSYYMVIDENTLLYVKDYNDASFCLFPSISQEKISIHVPIIASYGFDHISESEFKRVFLKVSLELEKLAN